MNPSVVPLDAFRCKDFYRIHSQANGSGWCYCVAWYVPTWQGWAQRSAEENRALREDLFQHRRYDGYLLYVDREPIGWCQCGPRDCFPKLLKKYNLTPDPEVWAITCFFIAPQFRKRGLTHHLISGVLKDLIQRGVSHVQGFPRRGQRLPDEDAWTGPEAVFLAAGFVVEGESSQGLIFGKRLETQRRIEGIT